MANHTATLKKPSETLKPAPKSAAGRVFSISLKGIPRVNAETRTRLEAAARAPNSKRRAYPQLVTE